MSKKLSGKSFENSNKDSKIVGSKAQTGSVVRRSVTRFTIIILLSLFANYYWSRSSLITIAGSDESVMLKTVNVSCSSEIKDHRFTSCIPQKCSRSVTDTLISNEEADQLLKIVKKGMKYGGSSGGASVLDLNSGALSKEDKFTNIFKLKSPDGQPVISSNDLQIYNSLRQKVQRQIADHFGISFNSLYLTKPTFFSRINFKSARTLHDEYWHPHIDKKTYGSFTYTSLIYLSTYKKDFEGGRFIFIDKEQNSTVEPRHGRVSFFTSGAENYHHVEKVLSGTRYALTIPFSCDPNNAIDVSVT